MGAAPDIPSLTGLRFVAAATIVLTHFGQASHASLFGLEWNISAVGMPLFFTLSGFIVHYVYAGAFARGWRVAAPNFALARFSRLYPLFFVLLLFYSLGPLGRVFRAHWDIGISYATLTGSWWYWLADGTTITTNRYGLSWSISTEVFFYLIYALGLYRIERIRSLRLCAGATIGFCVLSVALLYGVFISADLWEPFILARHPEFISANADVVNSFFRWLLYVSPYFHLLEFIAGCLICQLFLLAQRDGSPTWLRAAEPMAWLGAAWLVAALALLYATWYFGYRSDFFNFVNYLSMTFLMAPGCCLLILALALGGSSIGRALTYAVPVYLGEISYSIYLGHSLFHWLLDLAGINGPLLVMTVGVLAVVAGASLFYFVIELPAKRGLRMLFATLGETFANRHASVSAPARDQQQV
jgi:peptidoglycan/LPS O-acetylase OafA/YrhL